MVTTKTQIAALRQTSEPIDQTLSTDAVEIDFSRPTYRCRVCATEGDQAGHKYIDECPYFDCSLQNIE